MKNRLFFNAYFASLFSEERLDKSLETNSSSMYIILAKFEFEVKETILTGSYRPK